MNLRAAVKSRLLANPYGQRAYGAAQAWLFDRKYRARRERYEAVTASSTDYISNKGALAAVRSSLESRGVLPARRALGELHTYAYVPSNWPHQNQIARALEVLGPTSRFDYRSRGFTLDEIRRSARASGRPDPALMDQLVADVKRVHRQSPIDWFFSYALGWDLSPAALGAIRDLGIPAANISLDDKNWWDEIERGDPSGALSRNAPYFDITYTSAQVVLPWYRAEAAHAVFLPEGVDTEWFRPLDVPQDVDVGFVGSHFGWRARQVATLQAAGLHLIVHGVGWPSGELDDAAMRVFFNRSRINVGFGDMSYSHSLTNLKGRDFEIPATGRGIYITTYNSDLARCFDLGSEIRCYRDLDEAIELIRYYLRHPAEATEVARRGRERCVRDHQWSGRFSALAYHLGLLADLPFNAQASSAFLNL